MRLRSVVAVAPGADRLEDALASAADGVAVTLADARHPVAELREAARDALQRIAAAGKAALVTVNHPRTRLLREDVEAIAGPGLRGVFLPHTVEPQDVRDLAVVLREFEYNRGIEPGEILAFPVIDTARGLLRAPEIANAAPRVAGLLFDVSAYAGDIGARHEEQGSRFAYGRGAVVAAAHAYEALPLVTSAGLDLLQLAQAGFAGAVLTSTGPAMAANNAFTPAPVRTEAARADVAAYEAVRAEGGWVARVGTRVVDAHSVRKARRLLE